MDDEQSVESQRSTVGVSESEGPPSPVDDAVERMQAELEGARARITELELFATDRAVLEQEIAGLKGKVLEALRRSLIAENRGQVIEELIAGDSEEGLSASVETAKAAYARVAEQLRQVAAATVPVGSVARPMDRGEGLNPLQKIAHGLNRGG